MIRNAIIEGDYRYSLTREWDITNKKRALFIMLNPSTADAHYDDMTTTRCIHFAKKEQCGSLEICNLFGYKATYPKELEKLTLSEAIGNQTNYYLEKAFQNADIIVACWGEKGKLFKRSTTVKKLLRQWSIDTKKTIYYFGFTAKNEPRHPSRLPNDANLIEFLPSK
ncbi:DUF1643 domain-containing protein [Bacillus rhizoplanae]|uniref:DUF1643 domain-containing protein n=1 Tax=Bacillus rhizoplanae TaxID=2880966 RepID=UPI003D23C9EA